ncbi:hypothetical protein K438DRAFT_1772398 [Mycena galopus ATCC 62051]|nr:hypothetical protein K438DRAFT_1772398 [Mycena galopus ATCC 62051]
MGTKKNTTERKPTSSRTTGSRRSKKVKDNENTPPDGNPMQERTKRTRKKAAAATTLSTNDEDEAAAALMTMASPAGKTGDTLLKVSDDAVKVDSADEASKYAKSDEKSDVETQDSSSSEDETLDEVPYKHCTRDLTGLTSKTSFDEFLLAAAAKMETRITMLSSIGYVPSYKKPKPGPKLLDDEEAWDFLVADVRQHIKGAQSKNRGKHERKWRDSSPFLPLIQQR